MPKVSVDLGLTLKVSPESFNMIKPSVSYTDIDTAGDVAAQIAECDAALELIVDAAQKRIEQTSADLTGLDFDGLGFGSWKNGFFKTWANSIAGEMQRQKDLLIAKGIDDAEPKTPRKKSTGS